MDRRALIIGINNYGKQPDSKQSDGFSQLGAPCKDAQTIGWLLQDRDHNEQVWDVSDGGQLLGLGRPFGEQDEMTTAEMWKVLEHFFDETTGRRDDLFFYFAGHGCNRHGVGVLATSDSTQDQGGITMPELHGLIDKASKYARSITVVLDCCGSGLMNDGSQLPLHTSIITASYGANDALELGREKTAVFSSYLIEGLRGAASNDIFGNITVTSLVAYVHKRFAENRLPESQQPAFQCYLTQDPVLVQVEGALPWKEVKRITGDFEEEDSWVLMTPEHEQSDKEKWLGVNHDEIPSDELTEKQRQFDFFKKLQSEGLLAIEGNGTSLFWACGFDSKGNLDLKNQRHVYLTERGKALWRTVHRDAEANRAYAARGIR